MVAIAGFTRDQIVAAVRQMYAEVATVPFRQFHFPTGRDACLFVGYPESWLDGLPASALESFAGVGFPFSADVIRAGDRVLDIGSGSGTDTLIAARLVGPEGRVHALDMTPEMLDKLRRNIALAGADNIEVIEGDAEAIPLPDASVDVVTTNGVLNLVLDKPKAVAEIFRVLRPGGRVQIADVMLSRPVGPKARADPKLWAECVVGATIEDDYLDLFRFVGFDDVRALRSSDYFSGSSSSDTRRIASVLGAKAAEITMEKPLAVRPGALRWVDRLRPARLVRRVGQHGFAGLLASAGAIVACYGVLAVVGGLALMGLSVPIDARMWTGLIVALATMAPLAIAWNLPVHRNLGPSLLGGAGALLVLYAVLGSYDWRIEAVGFATLLGAALLDRHLFRSAVNC
jgi:arsenite methyltransferase